jgi:hypothetical protein
MSPLSRSRILAISVVSITLACTLLLVPTLVPQEGSPTRKIGEIFDSAASRAPAAAAAAAAGPSSTFWGRETTNNAQPSRIIHVEKHDEKKQQRPWSNNSETKKNDVLDPPVDLWPDEHDRPTNEVDLAENNYSRPILRLAIVVLLTTAKWDGRFDWRTLDGIIALRHSVLSKGIPSHAVVRHDQPRRMGLPRYRQFPSAAAAAAEAVDEEDVGSSIPRRRRANTTTEEGHHLPSGRRKGEESEVADTRAQENDEDGFLKIGTVATRNVSVHRFWVREADLEEERRALDAAVAAASGGAPSSIPEEKEAPPFIIGSSSSADNNNNNNQTMDTTTRRRILIVELRFIAIVTPELPKKVWNAARHVGFEVWPSDSPLNLSRVRRAQFRDELLADGATGPRELVKLDGFRMDAFDKVLFLDADVLFHRSLVPLLAHHEAVGWTEGGWASERINGGFLVFSPQAPFAAQHVHEIVKLLEWGDFRPGTGWEGAGIGWTYGGRTIQGILPHYLFLRSEAVLTKAARAFVSEGERTTRTPVLRAHRQLDRCRYNNMVQLPRCKATPYEQVVSNHFTGDCHKPWTVCPSLPSHPLCAKFTNTWVMTYREAFQVQFRSLPEKVQKKIRINQRVRAPCERESIGRAFSEIR